jgi:hypothetical protein
MAWWTVSRRADHIIERPYLMAFNGYVVDHVKMLGDNL